jgi:mannitol-specific phosphotransferase system IIBC component
MSYKPDESILAAYLYGELSKDEQAKVAIYLTEHPDAKRELDEIKSMQKLMGKLKDKEVTEPSFVFENPLVVVVSKHQFLSRIMKLTIGMAASIALLLLVGYFTELHVSFENQTMKLSFGDTKNISPTDTSNVTEDNIKAWMQESLAVNNQSILSKINDVETSLVDKVNTQNSAHSVQLKSMNTSNNIDQTIIDQYVSQLKEENKEIILRLVDVSERNQQQYMTAMMTDFSNYLDQQRTNDLEVIQTSFNNLKDNTEINQIETNELLASIISTVNDDTSGQF